MRLGEEAIHWRLVKFAGVGAVGTIGHYLTLIVLVDLANQDPTRATTVGFIVGALINYVLNYRYTFNSNKKHSVAFTQFITIAAIGIMINAFLMWTLNGLFSVHYLVAQVVATLLVLIWNFLGNHFWTFR